MLQSVTFCRRSDKKARGGEIVSDEKVTLEEWIENVSDEERRALVAKTKKRFWIFLLISLIPYVNFFTMGFAVFCYNNLNFLKTRGRSTGNNGVRALMMFTDLLFLRLSLSPYATRLRSLVLKYWVGNKKSSNSRMLFLNSLIKKEGLNHGNFNWNCSCWSFYWWLYNI